MKLSTLRSPVTPGIHLPVVRHEADCGHTWCFDAVLYFPEFFAANVAVALGAVRNLLSRMSCGAGIAETVSFALMLVGEPASPTTCARIPNQTGHPLSLYELATTYAKVQFPNNGQGWAIVVEFQASQRHLLHGAGDSVSDPDSGGSGSSGRDPTGGGDGTEKDRDSGGPGSSSSESRSGTFAHTGTYYPVSSNFPSTLNIAVTSSSIARQAVEAVFLAASDDSSGLQCFREARILFERGLLAQCEVVESQDDLFRVLSTSVPHGVVVLAGRHVDEGVAVQFSHSVVEVVIPNESILIGLANFRPIEPGIVVLNMSNSEALCDAIVADNSLQWTYAVGWCGDPYGDDCILVSYALLESLAVGCDVEEAMCNVEFMVDVYGSGAARPYFAERTAAILMVDSAAASVASRTSTSAASEVLDSGAGHLVQSGSVCRMTNSFVAGKFAVDSGPTSTDFN